MHRFLVYFDESRGMLPGFGEPQAPSSFEIDQTSRIYIVAGIVLAAIPIAIAILSLVAHG